MVVGSMVVGTAVVAHQGGWDEILLVLAPIVLIAVLLYVANRRAGSLDEAETDQPSGADPDRT